MGLAAASVSVMGPSSEAVALAQAELSGSSEACAMAPPVGLAAVCEGHHLQPDKAAAHSAATHSAARGSTTEEPAFQRVQ